MFTTRRYFSYIIPAAIVIAAFLFLASARVFAAGVCVWNGTTSANWNTAANWNAGCSGAGGIPATGDDVFFNGSGSNKTMNNDISGLSLHDLHFQDPAYVLGGNNLTVTGHIYNDGTGVTISAKILVGGNIVMQNATYSGGVTLNPSNTALFQVLNGDMLVSGTIDGTSSGGGTAMQTFSPYTGTISGNNTFTGNFYVSGPGVALASSTALGNSANIFYVLGDGVNLHLSGGITIPNFTVVNGANTFTNDSGTNAFSAEVFGNSGGAITTVVTAGSLNFSGFISQEMAMTHTTGLLIYSGSTGNTYSGGTIVTGGTLQLSKSLGQSIPGALTIGDSSGLPATAKVHATTSDQINDGTEVIIRSDGQWLMDDGVEDTVGPLTITDGSVSMGTGHIGTGGLITMTGGTLDTGTGYINPQGNISATSTLLTTATINGTIDFSSGTPTITTTDGPSTIDLQINAVIGGSGGITFAGAGQTALAGTNSYDGVTHISAGATVRLQDASALGGTTDGTVVADGGQVILGAGAGFDPEPISLSGTGTDGNGAMYVVGGAFPDWNGVVTLTGNTTVGVDSTSRNTFTDEIDGAFNLTIKNGTSARETEFDAVNTFTGHLIITQGTVVAAAVNAFPASVIVESTVNGVFKLNNTVQTVGEVTGNGEIQLGTGELVVGDAGNWTYDGLISGTDGAFTKHGSGTGTLTGDNTYTGFTTVNAGKLIINGIQSDSPLMIFGGTIGGSGSVGSLSILVAAHIAPGNSPGLINVVGDYNQSGTLDEEINGTVAGTSYDKIAASGSITLNGTSVLNVILGYTPTLGDTYTILQAGTTLTGTFNGLADGATVTVSGQRFRINYTSTAVTLTYLGAVLQNTGVDVPVSAAAAMILVGFAGLTTTGFRKYASVLAFLR